MGIYIETSYLNNYNVTTFVDDYIKKDVKKKKKKKIVERTVEQSVLDELA